MKIARTLMSMGLVAGMFAVAQADKVESKTVAAKPVAAPAAGAPAAPAAPKADKAAPGKEGAKEAGKEEMKKMPPAPAMPAAPEEIAAMAKAGGNWRCTGTAMGPNGEAKLSASIKNKVELDKWWIHTSFAESGGGKYKFESFTSYDAKSKKWHRIMVDNMGGQEVATSDGAKDGKVQWDATSRSMMGTGPARHHEDMSNPKELKMWGEYSADNGKTWVKSYDATCKH